MENQTTDAGNQFIPQEALTSKMVPPYYIESKNLAKLPSYWVKMQHTNATGHTYTKIVPRSKAYRMVNNRAHNWTIFNPFATLSVAYSLVD